jgi:ribosomal protein S27AE
LEVQHNNIQEVTEIQKNIPLEIKRKLKKCPICDTWMEGESSQEVSPWYIEFGKRVTNKNTIKCPRCGYMEIHIQRYSKEAVKMILGE